nr:immunoglobulin heavy chain junction region [Mus musculus]
CARSWEDYFDYW